MSWYLANENKLIDQFATSSGLGDLRRASESYPALHDFFEEGVSSNVAQCIEELNHLVRQTRDEDVKVTAQGLAGLMQGQTLAVITQGFGYEDEDEDDTPEPIEPTGPAARKAKKAAPKKKPAARKAKTMAVPKKDRAWFETKVAELKAEAERLPAARQTALRKKLREKPKGGR
jgi:hypothetical protein